MDFNVEFNNAFYTAMMFDMGNKTPWDMLIMLQVPVSEKSSVDQDTGSRIYENYSINPEKWLWRIYKAEGSDRDSELRIARTV